MCGPGARRLASILPRVWVRRLDVGWEWVMLRLEILLDSTVKVLGPLYVLLALVLILAIIYLAFTLLLPMSWPMHTPAGICHGIAAAWVSFNILFNFYCAATRHPGSPPPLALPDKESRGPQGDVRLSMGRAVADMQLNLSDSMPCVRWCDKCQNLKPPLTHHCHICERCVLKMDHHCPWMHNCIGLRNYRYFFLFLLYLWVGCGYSVVVATMLIADRGKDGRASPGVIFTFVVALAAFIAIALLLAWHVYLVATAQTTIDFYDFVLRRREARRAGRVWVNEFDLGVCRNFQAPLTCRGRCGRCSCCCRAPPCPEATASTSHHP
ncbi:hypothetical protein CLOM_g950 [Closterium sp. NIES-68]|nr:hypothetical protein CLOM_g950 [Closterium sp. NIES-68]